jgi:hypothetical protein
MPYIWQLDAKMDFTFFTQTFILQTFILQTFILELVARARGALLDYNTQTAFLPASLEATREK